MLRKFTFSCVALLALLVLQGTVRADPIITLSGRAGTGVTASILNYTLVPAGSGRSTFNFTIRNTSSSGVLTNIGFSLPGNRANTFVLNNASGDGSYVIRNDVQGNATGIDTEMDFALLTRKTNGGVPNNFNGGYTASGIDPGQDATFSITGDFSGMTAQQIASSIYARFQAVGQNGGSDVAGGPGNNSPSRP